jgi:hypothetical protein
MGNSWSASPSFTSELTIEDDEPPDPPDADCDQILKIRFLEAKNFFLFSEGKMQTLVRVSTNFNPQCYTKPVKCCVKDGQTEWFLPKKRFFF